MKEKVGRRLRGWIPGDSAAWCSYFWEETLQGEGNTTQLTQYPSLKVIVGFIKVAPHDANYTRSLFLSGANQEHGGIDQHKVWNLSNTPYFPSTHSWTGPAPGWILSGLTVLPAVHKHFLYAIIITPRICLWLFSSSRLLCILCHLKLKQLSRQMWNLHIEAILSCLLLYLNLPLNFNWPFSAFSYCPENSLKHLCGLSWIEFRFIILSQLSV